MKMVKKIASLVLALAMVFSLGISAFATNALTNGQENTQTVADNADPADRTASVDLQARASETLKVSMKVTWGDMKFKYSRTEGDNGSLTTQWESIDSSNNVEVENQSYYYTITPAYSYATNEGNTLGTNTTLYSFNSAEAATTAGANGTTTDGTALTTDMTGDPIAKATTTEGSTDPTYAKDSRWLMFVGTTNLTKSASFAKVGTLTITLTPTYAGGTTGD